MNQGRVDAESRLVQAGLVSTALARIDATVAEAQMVAKREFAASQKRLRRN